jgi:hypothetical protein
MHFWSVPCLLNQFDYGLNSFTRASWCPLCLINSHVIKVYGGVEVSSSVALQSLKGLRTPRTGGFVVLLRHMVRLFWTRNRSVTKASTYTGQHSTERRGRTSMLRVGFEPTIPVTKRPRHALDGAATGTNGVGDIVISTRHFGIVWWLMVAFMLPAALPPWNEPRY